MKRIKDFKWHHGTGHCKKCWYSEEKVRKEIIEQIETWLKKYPEINFADVKHVGVLESGDFQFKIPNSIKNIQVIILIAWLKWFYDIQDREIKEAK